MENQTFTTGATVAPANNQPTAGTPNPFKKAILALAAILVVGGVGASVYLNMGPAPAQGDPNEPPPSLTAAGGLKGSFVETQQGFLQYEAKDLVAFDANKSSLASKFGAPGTVKGNAVVNYMTVNADGMTMADFVNNYNPKADGNRALFLIYSAGQGGLSKGFHTYPAGPFGTATTEIKKDDLAKISLARNSGVIMIAKVDSESNGVLDPSVAPTSSSFPTPLLPDDKSGWVLVSGNGKLADLLGTNKDRVISAWALKDPTTFEKVDMNTYAFSTYHVAWLNLLPKSSVVNPTPAAVAPKITSVTPVTAVQGQKAVAFTITGSDLGKALCTGVGTTICGYSGKVEFNPAADFQNVTGVTVDTTGTSLKFVADIADGATADFKEIKVTTANGSVTDKSFKVTAKAVVNPLVGQTVLAHYNFPGTLATVQWFEAKVTAVTNNRYSYTFVNKIVSSLDGKAFDIDPTVTPGASVVDDFETNIAVPADAPYLEGEKDLFVIVKYKTSGGYWNARLNGKNADGTYAITYLNDKNADTVPLTKVYKPLGAKIHLEAEAVANKAGSPTITSLSVRAGVSGELAEFDINGTNLDKVTTLSLGGLEVGGTPLSNLTATKAHAKFIINTSIPVGPQDLVVTNPSGSAKATFTVKENVVFVITPGLGNAFNLLLAPTIKSLSVKEGVRGELVKIDITGTNLNNAGMLSLGGLDASGTPVSQTATTAHYEFWLNVNTPLGDQNLVVTNPFGSAKTTFTVKAPADTSTGLKVGSKVLALWNNHGKIASPNRWYTADIAKITNAVVFGMNVTTYDVNYTDGSGDKDTFLTADKIVDLAKPIDTTKDLKAGQIVVAKDPAKSGEWYNAIVLGDGAANPWTLMLVNDKSTMLDTIDVKNTYLTLVGYKEIGNFVGDIGSTTTTTTTTTTNVPPVDDAIMADLKNIEIKFKGPEIDPKTGDTKLPFSFSHNKLNGNLYDANGGKPSYVSIEASFDEAFVNPMVKGSNLAGMPAQAENTLFVRRAGSNLGGNVPCMSWEEDNTCSAGDRYLPTKAMGEVDTNGYLKTSRVITLPLSDKANHKIKISLFLGTDSSKKWLKDYTFEYQQGVAKLEIQSLSTTYISGPCPYSTSNCDSYFPRSVDVIIKNTGTFIVPEVEKIDYNLKAYNKMNEEIAGYKVNGTNIAFPLPGKSVTVRVNSADDNTYINGQFGGQAAKFGVTKVALFKGISLVPISESPATLVAPVK